MEDSIVEFATDHLADPAHSVNTVYGYVTTLTNFTAYLYREDPEVLIIRLLSKIGENVDICDIPLSNQQNQVLDFEENSGCEWSEISGLVGHLRRSYYGSRIHAFVELILATKSRPSSILDLDHGNIDWGEETVVIDLPDTYVVSESGLVTTRTVSLPERAKEALKEYIEFNRIPVSDDSSRPVFTTHQGRASAATIRRTLKQRHEEFTSTTKDAQRSDASDARLTSPHDVRLWALSQMGE